MLLKDAPDEDLINPLRSRDSCCHQTVEAKLQHAAGAKFFLLQPRVPHPREDERGRHTVQSRGTSVHRALACKGAV